STSPTRAALRLGNMSSSKAKAKTKSKKSKRAASPSPGGSAQFLLTCDPPMKQFIINLNDQKIADKKFILEDLDATHLLIKGDARDEITRKVEEWMDQNVYSSIERLGENLDTS
ncbi:hypothetical protein ACHAXR_008457, partial [Thalassiosira sp. AJA248-18]